MENAALVSADRADSVVVIVESKARGELVRYHQQKLVLVYSGLRHFARDLRAAGWRVDHHRFEETPDFLTGLQRHVEKFRPEEIRLAEPNDHEMTTLLPKFERRLGVPVRTVPTRQFLLERADFAEWAGQSKHLVMEEHYRRMRRQTGWLMEKVGSRKSEVGNQQSDGKARSAEDGPLFVYPETGGGLRPVGGEWNYDPLNRQTFRQYAASGRMQREVPGRETPDEITQEVIVAVEREFAGHPGRARDFWFPVDRAGALRWLERFVEERLASFGPWEDVSAQGQPVLYHSVLSPLLNLGLLHPRECVERVLRAFEEGRAPIQSVEGFVRQVAGWREFINGAYWQRMPGYKDENFLGADRALPGWFYTGETEMNCLRQVITQALELGWVHHIQRLMIVGNFLLIAGIAPLAALRWYLEMTVDAYDWVMVPNALGIILYADGGFVATKPYAAGAGYIHKMSNYCEGCRYSPLKKTGPEACPFNALYWDFHGRHADVLRGNPRVSRVVQAWEGRSEEERRAVRKTAGEFLERMKDEG